MQRFLDPIHGFIHLTPIEQLVVRSLPFQRLHYIRQLGVSYLVFPGAKHSRFEHSLGTMYLASLMFDHVMTNRSHLGFVLDKAWLDYWRQIVRLGALCHDLGHLPFSHVAESLYLPLGHEEMSYRIISSAHMKTIWDSYSSPDGLRAVCDDVCKVAVGSNILSQIASHLKMDSWETILSLLITGDDFGADRMDYLMRDAYFTGVGYGAIDYRQMIENITIVCDHNGDLTLAIEEKALQAVESLLLARHFMHARIYHNPKTKVYSFHMRQFLSQEIPSIKKESIEEYLLFQDGTVEAKIWQVVNDKNSPAYLDALSLMHQSTRFRYHPLNQDADIGKKLLLLKERFGRDLGYENKKKVYEKEASSLLVKKEKDALLPARDLSMIYQMVKAPSQSCWLFVNVDKEAEILQYARSLNLIS